MTRSTTRGALTSLRRAEELGVHLARGCATLTVEFGGGLAGEELMLGPKRACDRLRQEVMAVRWPRAD
eukprot:10200498-Alexandrium_andersonii.AAC.1